MLTDPRKIFDLVAYDFVLHEIKGKAIKYTLPVLSNLKEKNITVKDLDLYILFPEEDYWFYPKEDSIAKLYFSSIDGYEFPLRIELFDEEHYFFNQFCGSVYAVRESFSLPQTDGWKYIKLPVPILNLQWHVPEFVNLKDNSKEIERITNQIESIEKELSNKNFLDKAPVFIVEKKKKKLSDLRNQLEFL